MRILAICVALAALFCPVAAQAHPHVFIDYMVQPQVRNGAIVGLRLLWRFDELYSGVVLDSVDTDGDGRLSQPEIDAIARRTLATMEGNGFYTHLTLDGTPWQAKKAEGFSASVERDQITYAIAITLPAPAKTVTVTAYDPEFYIEMLADKAQAQAGGPAACRVGPAPAVKTQYYGSFTPDLVTCAVGGR